MTEKYIPEKILIKNARLSFPSLFQKEVFNGKAGKFAATLIIDKNDKEVKKQIDKAIAAALGSVTFKIKSDMICLKDGDDSDYDSSHGSWTIKAANSKRPQTLDKDKSQVTEEDEKFYAGCRVNAVIDFWVQNNEFGKRINANLYLVQFFGDDEPFGSAAEDVSGMLDDFDEDGDI